MHTYTYNSRSWSIHPSIFTAHSAMRGKKEKFNLCECQCVSVQPWMSVCVFLCCRLLSAIPGWHHSTICLSVGLCWHVPPLEARTAAHSTMTALCPHAVHCKTPANSHILQLWEQWARGTEYCWRTEVRQHEWWFLTCRFKSWQTPSESQSQAC